MMMLRRLSAGLLGLCLLPAAAAAQRTEAEAVAAEGASPGGFFEWIHKLSGPGIVSVGGSLFYQFSPNERGQSGGRVRATVSHSIIVVSHDAFDDDSTSVKMFSTQLRYELPLYRRLWLEGAAGATLHKFSGDGFDSFTHYSFPISAIFRPDNGVTVGGLLVIPVLEGTLRIFPAFPSDAFRATSGAPRFLVTVERDGMELVPGAALRFDVRKR